MKVIEYRPADFEKHTRHMGNSTLMGYIHCVFFTLMIFRRCQYAWSYWSSPYLEDYREIVKTTLSPSNLDKGCFGENFGLFCPLFSPVSVTLDMVWTYDVKKRPLQMWGMQFLCLPEEMTCTEWMLNVKWTFVSTKAPQNLISILE